MSGPTGIPKRATPCHDAGTGPASRRALTRDVAVGPGASLELSSAPGQVDTPTSSSRRGRAARRRREQEAEDLLRHEHRLASAWSLTLLASGTPRRLWRARARGSRGRRRTPPPRFGGEGHGRDDARRVEEVGDGEREHSHLHRIPPNRPALQVSGWSVDSTIETAMIIRMVPPATDNAPAEKCSSLRSTSPRTRAHRRRGGCGDLLRATHRFVGRPSRPSPR